MHLKMGPGRTSGATDPQGDAMSNAVAGSRPALIARRAKRGFIGTTLTIMALSGFSLTSAALTGAAGAQTQQHPFSHVDLTWGRPAASGWNVDQYVTVHRKGRATFWANTVYFERNNELAYIGLQTNGGPGHNGREQAIFSVWNGTDARGPGCGPFGHEGSGWSCSIPLKFKRNRAYMLRVWAVGSAPNGEWWSGMIIDSRTRREYWIGKILAPAGAGHIVQNVAFVEYFGQRRPCDQVPRSTATFSNPGFNSRGGGFYDAVPAFERASQAHCLRATVTRKQNGVFVDYGGRGPRVASTP